MYLAFYETNVYTSSLELASCVHDCGVIARYFGRCSHGKVEEGGLRYFLRSGWEEKVSCFVEMGQGKRCC